MNARKERERKEEAKCERKIEWNQRMFEGTRRGVAYEGESGGRTDLS